MVKGSPSMPLALNKVPSVLIAQETLRFFHLPQDPHVCASSMLPGGRDGMIHG